MHRESSKGKESIMSCFMLPKDKVVLFPRVDTHSLMQVR